MERYFPVTVCGKQAGKILVRQQGLYYHFQCRCDLSGDVIYRLMVTCGTARESLGILIPGENGFVLDTRLPVKRFGAGEMTFFLIPNHEKARKTFIPIHPEEPFAYISRLKHTFLALQNGQPGIRIEQEKNC